MLIRSVRKTIDQYRMLQPSDSVLVAVSGGPDSVALLHLLLSLQAEYGLTLAVGHFHHQLRGAAADEDARFVQSLAARWGLACRVGTADVKAHAQAEGLSWEEAGRILRYRFLRETAQALGARRLALGHTRDDQAETVLLRLLRGAGTTGLCGIYPVWTVGDGITVIRPLLLCGRSEILRFLQAQAIAYREDESNRDLRFDRNRVRAQLLPALVREFNPQAVATLAHHATLAQEDEAWMAEMTEAEAHRLWQQQGDTVSVRVPDLRAHPLGLQRRLLRLGIRRLKGDLRQIEYVHVEALRALCEDGMSGKEAHLPGGLCARREFSYLILSPRAVTPPPAFSYRLSIPGSVPVPEAACTVNAERLDGYDPAPPPASDSGALTAVLDAGLVGDAVVVRNRRPGDRCLLGTGESRKVKEIFIAQKVPRHLRDRIPLITRPSARDATPPKGGAVVHPAEVLWIPGCFLARSLAAAAASGPWVRLTVIYRHR